LLSSEFDGGVIDASSEKVAFRLRLSVDELEAAIAPLICSGFFDAMDDASEALARCNQDALLETETETETENREEKTLTPLSVKPDEDHRKYDSIPYVDLVGAYHKLCPSLPKVREITDKRRKAMKSAWKKYEKHEGGFPAVLDTLFKKAEQSDFLTGRSDGWGGAGFDWLMKESNMVKVLEGNYENKDRSDFNHQAREPSQQAKGAMVLSEMRRRLRDVDSGRNIGGAGETDVLEIELFPGGGIPPGDGGDVD
jgi:hypothetical protein